MKSYGICLYIFWILTPHWMCIGKYLLRLIRLSFHFVNGFRHCANHFRSIQFHVFIFLFPLPKEHIQKLLLRAKSKTLLPMFSSRSFMASGLILKSLIHFESILAYGVREWSSFSFCMYLSSFLSTVY